MRLRGGFRRLAALVVGGVLILTVVGTRPRWQRVTGRVVPVPAGGRPHLVEVVEPEGWMKVTGWTDGAGRFFLFMARRGTAHTLRVERSDCDPAVVEGVQFKRGRDTVIRVLPC